MEIFTCRDEIYHFRRALEDVPYYWKKIVLLHEKIDSIRYEMTGLARHGITLTPEQEKSSLPMPRYSSHRSLEEWIDELEELRAEQDDYRKRILACETIERLQAREKDLLIDAFIFHVNRWDLAEKHGLTPRGLNKRLHMILKKCI
ncbi:MAG: hypothetical protein K2H85_06595 [Allobaculum sp.]|nr:hypothetical protein [Allobaculum sp.]